MPQFLGLKSKVAAARKKGLVPEFPRNQALRFYLPPSRVSVNDAILQGGFEGIEVEPALVPKELVSRVGEAAAQMRLYASCSPACGPAATWYTASTCTKMPPFAFTGMPIWANRASTHSF